MEVYTLQKAANLVMNVRTLRLEPPATWPARHRCHGRAAVRAMSPRGSGAAGRPQVSSDLEWTVLQQRILEIFLCPQVDGCIGALFLDLLYSSSMFSQVRWR